MPVSEFPDSISDLGPRFVLVRSSRPGGRLVLLFRRASGFPRMTPEFDRGWPRIVFPVAESALRAHRFASLCVRPPKSVLFSTTWREAVTVPVSVRSAVGLRMVGGNFDRRIARVGTNVRSTADRSAGVADEDCGLSDRTRRTGRT